MPYKLLGEFAKLFEGKKYNHRVSNQGDIVASFLFEDLYDMGKSAKLVAHVKSQDRVSNRQNQRIGKAARRGDGTFGERVPGTPVELPTGLAVAVGAVATVEIGAEVKMLAKAMIKQIDRVGTDMKNQVEEFRQHGGKPICVGIVGINHAPAYTSYEKNTEWPTDGKKYKHPSQEAAEAEKRIVARVGNLFDELIILRFMAGNVAPYKFAWVDLKDSEKHYAASLVRISREYETRF